MLTLQVSPRHTIVYLDQDVMQSADVTHSEIIEHTDTLNVCFGSQIAYDARDEQAMILHREATVPPVDILACYHPFWWSPLYYICDKLGCAVDSRRYSLVMMLSIERLPLHAVCHLLQKRIATTSLLSCPGDLITCG